MQHSQESSQLHSAFTGKSTASFNIYRKVHSFFPHSQKSSQLHLAFAGNSTASFSIYRKVHSFIPHLQESSLFNSAFTGKSTTSFPMYRKIHCYLLQRHNRKIHSFISQRHYREIQLYFAYTWKAPASFPYTGKSTDLCSMYRQEHPQLRYLCTGKSSATFRIDTLGKSTASFPMLRKICSFISC